MAFSTLPEILTYMNERHEDPRGIEKRKKPPWRLK